MKTLTDLMDFSSNEVSTEPRYWPYNGEEIEITIIVRLDEDDNLERSIVEPITYTLWNVLTEYDGTLITDSLFCMSELPESFGKYKASVKFFTECSTDWESGIEECDCGFNIIRCERVK